MDRRIRKLLATLVAMAATAVPTSGQESASPFDWVVDGEAVYEARDPLASWSGRAPLAATELRFDPVDPATLQLTARVRPADFDSGSLLRDLTARRTVFEVADHPVASARASADRAAGPPRRLPGGWAVPIAVDLTLHGVVLRYAAVAQLERDGADWTGTALLVLSLEGHGMRRPRLLGFVTEDLVRLEVRVRARPAP